MHILGSALLAVLAMTGLNDTGQRRCYGADGSVRPCTGAPLSDDGRYGRDAAASAGALRKRGGGVAGFDFTKIANDGRELPATAAQGTAPADWACTRDNVTGLTWEVKTANQSDLRFGGHQYRWYNTNPSENGGVPGAPGSRACFPSPIECTTRALVDAVNQMRLCTHTDWRLPTPAELRSIVDYGDADTRVGVDLSYFPNVRLGRAHWTAYSYAPDPRAAWVVELGELDGGGAGHFHAKLPDMGIEGIGEEHTILVRGPQSTGFGPCSAGTPVANLPVATPASDFVDHGDGTVTHVPTGLMWKRCTEGLSGLSCGDGQATTMTWDGAHARADSSTFAGYDDWRLPNVKELHSIVETCGYDPAINTTVFPNVPRPAFGAVYFTSTTWAAGASSAWLFMFDRGGGVGSSKPKQGGLFVRLVRGGASSGSFDAQNPPVTRRRAVRH